MQTEQNRFVNEGSYPLFLLLLMFFIMEADAVINWNTTYNCSTYSMLASVALSRIRFTLCSNTGRWKTESDRDQNGANANAKQKQREMIPYYCPNRTNFVSCVADSIYRMPTDWVEINLKHTNAVTLNSPSRRNKTVANGLQSRKQMNKQNSYIYAAGQIVAWKLTVRIDCIGSTY